jgi:transcriptional regulator GlxA family with amidase domain
LKTDQRSSHIPVVMLTARATVGDKITGLQHGADAWLTKPFDRAELFATLAAMIESRRRLRMYFEYEKTAAPAAEIASLVQKENEFLQRVRTFIDAHLDDDAYDIHQLCLDLAMSRMQLHRKLTALGAPSAALFIRNHRLSRAQVLLKTTEFTVAEVAFKTGFSDPAYFSRCFREAFGKSPSEWRNA